MKGKSKKLVDITQELIEESQAMICESTITRITFEFNITYIFIGATFPTPNGITEEMARNNCTSFISLSSAGNACQAIAEVDTQGNLENCIDDIRITDSMEWLTT
ncbi:uncharacterized protein LOC144618721 [Crassostrea virginica]